MSRGVVGLGSTGAMSPSDELTEEQLRHRFLAWKDHTPKHEVSWRVKAGRGLGLPCEVPCVPSKTDSAGVKGDASPSDSDREKRFSFPAYVEPDWARKLRADSIREDKQRP